MYWFSKKDLKYVYSQIPLDKSIAKHCNFSILERRATGTYRIISGLYGLTDMPGTFQKTTDKTLEGISYKFVFLNDILVITKGSLGEHEYEHELEKIVEKLDKESLAINLEKNEYAENIIECLGLKKAPQREQPH